MKIEIIDPSTGRPFVVESSDLSSEDLEMFRSFDFSAETLKSKLDQLHLSADAKRVLFKLSDFTIKVGNVIVKVGQKVLDFAIQLFTHYPHTGFGIILGAILGGIIGMIPVLGPPLSALLTPVMVALGMLQGFSRDTLSLQIQEAVNAKFRRTRA